MTSIQILDATFQLRSFIDGTGTAATEHLEQSAMGWQWRIKFDAAGNQTGVDLVMEISAPISAGTQLWLAWADPRPGHEVKPDPGVRLADGVVRGNLVGWADPLVPQPWRAEQFFYGAPPYDYDQPRLGYCPFLGCVTCIPALTRIDGNRAVTFVLRPEDAKIDLVIETTDTGTVRFRHKHYRSGGGVHPAFTMEIFVHEADPRAALGAIVDRWPKFFHSEIPFTDEVAGCGAYSTHMGDMDPEKLCAMAFGVNWKASFDFPYMGMFLPPVADEEEWTSFGNRPMSVRKMRDYAAEMHGHGFHVLSYFNLNEFGAHVRIPRPAVPDAGSWKDQYAWLCDVFPQAVLRPPIEEKPDWPDVLAQPEHEGPPPVYWSWEGCVALDPGDPAYADFLIEQAARHIAKIPEASGICIDRLDWLRLFNHDADDGIAWFGGRPVRSLHTSHRQIMERLGRLLHSSKKVVFVNNHVKRIEQMRHADGIFDEFTYGGCSLNTSGLLCLFKPALGWTADVEQLRADPDGFYQRHLHMGVYPMAPFPGNDHSLGPSEFANSVALDYGAIFNLLKGKRWILTPGLVDTGGAPSRWNAFRCDAGVLLVFTGVASGDLDVRIRSAERLGLQEISQGRAFHPGRPEPETVALNAAEGDLNVRMQIHRGCAALLLPSNPS